MNGTVLRCCLAAAFVCAWGATQVELSSQTPQKRWLKGNLHTHTINSDGDSAPDAVARWYKENRYQFLALTDHNYFTDPQGLNSVMAAQDRFLLITGEEVTSGFGDASVHVNAFGIEATIPPAYGRSVLDTIQANVERIRSAGSVPSLNHPSYEWSVGPDDFASVPDLKLFEVFNGILDTNDEWELEAMWDGALTAGRRIYGIAVDDAHEFKQWGPEHSNPGRGWVQTLASELSESAIVEALEDGDFYASTGVELDSMVRGDRRIDLRIAPNGDERYRIRFVGADGKTLAEVSGLEASYTMRPDDRYVRATVRGSTGRRAWIQPIFAE